MDFTEKQRQLACYLKENNIMVSEKCCTVSKKKPLMQYIKEHKIDLNVTGERKAEGGQRAFAHKSCFSQTSKGYDKYMPLFWWSDGTKADFKRAEQIRYSDCYEVYGMKRTGCCGCPFNPRVKHDLETLRKYEPKIFKAVMNVFGRAYAITDLFSAKRSKCMPDGIDISDYL